MSYRRTGREDSETEQRQLFGRTEKLGSSWVDKGLVKREFSLGFPGGAAVKNPPTNAGDTGSSPWSGKIPHAAEQLSPCTTITEPAL